MKTSPLNSMERVLTSLSHREPDRVPLFLLLTMHGARETGLSIKEYFSKPEYVAEGQKKLQKKYGNDCYYPFFYAPIEAEAFGGEVIFTDDGPPNTGTPVIKNIAEIDSLRPPDLQQAKVLHRVLKCIEMLKDNAKGAIPIIGVVMSPFSLPVMQLGFEKYLDILINDELRFKHLMEVNKKFCTEWANAQLHAGATAICYFDPVSSPVIIPKELYVEKGLQIAISTIAGIDGPVATHFASGACLPIADYILKTGTTAVGISAEEDITQLKRTFQNKVSIIGNMNGVEMRRWSLDITNNVVKEIIQKAAAGGGFILSDNHGEIPFQVPESVLLAISETVREFGRYPINNT